MVFATDAPRVLSGRVLALGGTRSTVKELPHIGSVLAFDFGATRIGVAVGDLALRIPHAVGVIPSVPHAERYRAAGKLIDEWRPVLLAVGVPVQADGVRHPLAAACDKFARSLEGRFRLPVARVDESFSSCAASAALSEAGVRGRAQKSRLDAAAAAAILAVLFSEIDVTA
jgi:putative Holliday junction resolvase